MRGGSPVVPVLATRGRNRTGSTGGLGQDLLGKKFKPSGFFFLFAWNGSLCVLWEEGISLQSLASRLGKLVIWSLLHPRERGAGEGPLKCLPSPLVQVCGRTTLFAIYLLCVFMRGNTRTIVRVEVTRVVNSFQYLPQVELRSSSLVPSAFTC